MVNKKPFLSREEIKALTPLLVLAIAVILFLIWYTDRSYKESLNTGGFNDTARKTDR